MHRNIQPFKRSGCPILLSCFVRLNSTKTVFVRSFISICLGFLYVITHTEKNSVATWWAIGISLSTRMCCNGNNSVRLCFTSSDRCAHFVAVRIHITYSKIHCFPNNHHIYWVCCVFFFSIGEKSWYVHFHSQVVRANTEFWQWNHNVLFLVKLQQTASAHTVIQFHSDISIKFRQRRIIFICCEQNCC